jgi:predicted ferric reductase
MWWVLAGSVSGLVASSLMIVYWFSRLRLAIAKKGWKYTSTLGALPWIIGLFNSIYVLMRELTVIQKGGTVDSTLLYTLAALYWIVLATMGTGIILDAVKMRQSSKTRLNIVYG